MIKKVVAIAAATGGLVLAGAGMASADVGAQGAAIGSPGPEISRRNVCGIRYRPIMIVAYRPTNGVRGPIRPFVSFRVAAPERAVRFGHARPPAIRSTASACGGEHHGSTIDAGRRR